MRRPNVHVPGMRSGREGPDSGRIRGGQALGAGGSRDARPTDHLRARETPKDRTRTIPLDGRGFVVVICIYIYVHIYLLGGGGSCNELNGLDGGRGRGGSFISLFFLRGGIMEDSTMKTMVEYFA